MAARGDSPQLFGGAGTGEARWIRSRTSGRSSVKRRRGKAAALHGGCEGPIRVRASPAGVRFSSERDIPGHPRSTNILNGCRPGWLTMPKTTTNSISKARTLRSRIWSSCGKSRICFVRRASEQHSQVRILLARLVLPDCAVSRSKTSTLGVSVRGGWRRHPLQPGRSSNMPTHCIRAIFFGRTQSTEVRMV